MFRTKRLLIGLLTAVVSVPVLADIIGDADVILCASVHTTRCSADGTCESGLPWNWNIPRFIEVDLKKKVLETTDASGEDRSTPIEKLEREDGRIILQGVEEGRAFSMVIAEDTGTASVAVATEGLSIVTFGACTPVK